MWGAGKRQDGHKMESLGGNREREKCETIDRQH